MSFFMSYLSFYVSPYGCDVENIQTKIMFIQRWVSFCSAPASSSSKGKGCNSHERGNETFSCLVKHRAVSILTTKLLDQVQPHLFPLSRFASFFPIDRYFHRCRIFYFIDTVLEFLIKTGNLVSASSFCLYFITLSLLLHFDPAFL